MVESEDILAQIRSEKDRELSRQYFDKYWLRQDEFDKKWSSILQGIFSPAFQRLPNFAFQQDIRVFPFLGGEIFESEAELKYFQGLMKSAGDSEFVVIENVEVRYEGSLPTRFVYPVDITWDELQSGGITGTEHLTNLVKDYFLIGDSGVWGEYVGNSYWFGTETLENHTVKLVGAKATKLDRLYPVIEQLKQLTDHTLVSALLCQSLLREYQDSLVINQED